MCAAAPPLRYVLITCARNEADLIQHPLKSIVAQTVRPIRWVIVDDGSTDLTAEIVEQFAARHDFIRLVRITQGSDRNFARKAHAFARGLATLNDLAFDFIGNLDADISLDPDYYASVLSEFQADSNLGIGGGIVYTKIGDRFSTSDETLTSVAGAVQLFRRPCFEAVGGYTPLGSGGIDAVAEIKARMLGWTVKKFLRFRVLEHRRTGSAQMAPLRAKIREGERFHSLGYSAIFFVVRCLYRVKDEPILLGSVAAMLGFAWSALQRRPILVPPDVVLYLRREQRARLRVFQKRPDRYPHVSEFGGNG